MRSDGTNAATLPWDGSVSDRLVSTNVKLSDSVENLRVYLILVLLIAHIEVSVGLRKRTSSKSWFG